MTPETESLVRARAGRRAMALYPKNERRRDAYVQGALAAFRGEIENGNPYQFGPMQNCWLCGFEGFHGDERGEEES